MNQSLINIEKEKYIGLKFYKRPEYVCKVLKPYNTRKELYYLIEELNILTGEKRSDGLFNETDILRYLKNQEEEKEIIKSNIKYCKKQKEKELQRLNEERKIQEEYEFCYGFCDKLTPMQKGRVLKILNKKYNYSDYGILTRKDFVLKELQGTGFPCLEHNVKMWKRTGIKIIDNYYTLNYTDKDYKTEITKTEYDYANYLIKNDFV